MVNWSDPKEILKDSDAFEKIIFAFFGMQMWELFMTCDFEWSLLTRRRRFRWPLVRFHTCARLSITLTHSFRYSSSCPDTAYSFRSLDCAYLPPSVCGPPINAISGSSPSRSASLFTFNSWTGNMTILCASTSLMLRTVALWERKRSVVIPLGLLALTHWVLLYRTMFVVRAVWDHNLGTCIVVSTNPSLLRITFFFTMGFDFIILVATAVALMGRHSARTDLWRLLFTDGLCYFVVTFSMNCIPAVLNLLNLNSPMNVCVTYYLPAESFNSMAACRAVMRLLEYNSDVYVHSVMPSSDMPFPRFVRPEGVLVTTEHITMNEFP
ncbi:hypothetical protein DFH08DRAFT_675693 [Mycena albidolilacea]|uniref:Uncharacterized protein n=1 Tax=Mycena albidolilacea TaxID=1033008 RepID=A0AAD7AU32_9AGAR|nr:hypothetical protein DFH08DRAFT_675693 [Mycena albidolilacea]